MSRIKEISKSEIARFLKAYHKMNCAVTPGERRAANLFRLRLWAIADILQNKANRVSNDDKEFSALANELKEIVCTIPWMEK